MLASLPLVFLCCKVLEPLASPAANFLTFIPFISSSEAGLSTLGSIIFLGVSFLSLSALVSFLGSSTFFSSALAFFSTGFLSSALTFLGVCFFNLSALDSCFFSAGLASGFLGSSTLVSSALGSSIPLALLTAFLRRSSPSFLNFSSLAFFSSSAFLFLSACTLPTSLAVSCACCALDLDEPPLFTLILIVVCPFPDDVLLALGVPSPLVALPLAIASSACFFNSGLLSSLIPLALLLALSRES